MQQVDVLQGATIVSRWNPRCCDGAGTVARSIPIIQITRMFSVAILQRNERY